MTAQELYEIVKDVPREAWPEGISFTTLGPRFLSECGPDERRFEPTNLVEAAFVGAMVRHQIDIGNIVWQRESDGVFCVGPWNSGEQVEASTLIEALAAACKQKQEDDDGN